MVSNLVAHRRLLGQHVRIQLISWFICTASSFGRVSAGNQTLWARSFSNVCSTSVPAFLASTSSRGSIRRSKTNNLHRISKTKSITTMSGHNFKVWEDGRAEAVSKCILPLSENSYKGSSGRIAILGGSARYTGAPFYAAMASLQAGADLAYVFTAEEAALPIKCYSPELMVAPVYSAAEFDRIVENNQLESEEGEKLIRKMVDQVKDGIQRLHCLVIGPGLGRCPMVMKAVGQIIEAAREQNLHLVLDADALYMLSLPEYKDLLKDYDKAILTPNVVEYKRLFQGLDNNKNIGSPYQGVTIVQKGKHDQIELNGSVVLTCEEVGGLKRSGGIGDILAGTIGTLAAWNSILSSKNGAENTELQLSAWVACCFLKQATKKAYKEKRRAMTAPDILDKLGLTIDEMTNN